VQQQGLQESHTLIQSMQGTYSRAFQKSLVPVYQHLNTHTIAQRQGPSWLHPRTLQEWEAIGMGGSLKCMQHAE